MKKKLLILLFLFLCTGLYFLKRPILILKVKTVELGQDYILNPNDFIDSSSKNIDIKNIKISCDFQDKVGEYKVTVTYFNQTKETKLMIQDTTSPTFIKCPEQLSLYVNEDILSHFEATDLSDFSLSIQEEIDPSKPIDTTIHIQAIDIYSNTSIHKCHLILKEEKEQEISNTEPVINNEPIFSTFEIEPSIIEDTPIYYEPVIEQPVCPFSGSVGNSGMIFNSYSEAISYGDSYLMNNLWTYSGYSTEKIGCPDVWTVSFY